MKLHWIAATTIALAAVGCASTSQRAAPVGEQAPSDVQKEQQIIGKAAPGSGFARLAIGMDMQEVQNVMGHAPDRLHTYESGKRWIPFYFGTDARRMQTLYKGDGCLIFTGGNAWGGGGGELIQIENDPSGACYQP